MLNTIILMSRLTAEPELRHTNSDIPVTSFRLAVDRDYQKAGTEKQTDFFNIVAWRSTAEFVSRYFHKGQLVAVKGMLQSRNYTDQDGNKRTAYEVVADNVYFAEPKRDSYGDGSTPRYDSNAPASQQQAQPSFSTADMGDFEEISMGDDDDLPF